MNRQISSRAEDRRIQLMMEKQLEFEAQLRQCEDNINIFQTYYLSNSWRTGNLYLGWPICSYNDISQFINRPRAKKSSKPYLVIDQHQKLFSLSSLESYPFSNISNINYLATKQLAGHTRSKIVKVGRKKKMLKQENFKKQIKQNIKKEEEEISLPQMMQQQDSELVNSQSQQKVQDHNKIKILQNIQLKEQEPKRVTFKLKGKQIQSFISQSNFFGQDVKIQDN